MGTKEITTNEAADLLGVSPRRVRAMLAQGHIRPTRKFCRLTLYRLADIERFRRDRIRAGIQAESTPE